MTTYTATRVAEMTGASYRQLDHWTRAGFLPVTVEAQGSGTRRGYSLREALIARIYIKAQRALAGGDPTVPWGIATISERVRTSTIAELVTSPYVIHLNGGMIVLHDVELGEDEADLSAGLESASTGSSR